MELSDLILPFEIGLLSGLLLFLWMRRRRSREEKLFFPLCDSPNCVRCNRNEITRQEAMERFQEAYSENSDMDRIWKALSDSKHIKHLIFLQELRSFPVWDLDTKELCESVQILESNFIKIREEYEVVRQIKEGWQFNCAKKGSAGDWRVFSFLNQGQWAEENLRRCPETARLVASLPALMGDTVFAHAFFSVLPPNTEIEPHRGPCNLRLRCHLALQVPSKGECVLRVADQTCHWTVGRCLLFDDSLPHSVLYRTELVEEERVLLLVDFWHPDLSMKERQCLEDIF